MTGVWNTTMTLRSSTNPDVPTGGVRRGILTVRVEGDSAQVEMTVNLAGARVDEPMPEALVMHPLAPGDGHPHPHPDRGAGSLLLNLR